MRLKIKLIRILIVPFFLLCGNVLAQQPQLKKNSLKDVLKFALDNSPKVIRSELTIREAASFQSELKSKLLPQINGSAEIVNNIALPVTILPGDIIGQPGVNLPVELGVKYEGNAMLGVEQVLFNAGLFADIKVGKNAGEIAVLKQQMTDEELLFNVSSIFYEILHQQKKLENVQHNFRLLDSLTRQTKMRVEQDLTREIDLNRMQVNLTSLSVSINNLQQIVIRQKSYLKLLIGLPLSSELSLEGDNLESGSVSSEYVSKDATKKEKIELRILDKEKKGLELELKKTEQAYLPDLSFMAKTGYVYQSETFNLSAKNTWSDVSFIGLKMNIPIFGGFATRHKIQQAKLKVQQLEVDIKEQKNLIEQQLSDAILQLHVSHKSVLAQEGNVKLAEKVYNQGRMLYQEGLYDVSDLLQIESAYYDAKAAHIEEIINLKQSEINLLKARGDLKNLIK